MGMKSRRQPKHIDEVDTVGMIDESNAGGIETTCPNREDGQHCQCWYDNEPCCACGDDGDG